MHEEGKVLFIGGGMANSPPYVSNSVTEENYRYSQLHERTLQVDQPVNSSSLFQVASTFKGVIRALRSVSAALIEHKVQIWVRRAGYVIASSSGAIANSSQTQLSGRFEEYKGGR